MGKKPKRKKPTKDKKIINIKPEPRFISALDFTKAVQRIEARLFAIEQIVTAINDSQTAVLQEIAGPAGHRPAEEQTRSEAAVG